MQNQNAQSANVLLGRYRIIEVRDQGGFGNVLVAWDIRLQRRVAIKQIPLDESSTMFQDALAEARTASLLAHPNIVTVHDFISDAEYAYLVMEYVGGYSLAELLKTIEDHMLIYDEVVYVFSKLCDALDFAHTNGVLHLDLKPANILIDRAGNVKLADFGMAALMSAAGFGDARGGTLGYMPAEQLQGNVVDERTDIFSLACVMYEALVGVPALKSAPTKKLEVAFNAPLDVREIDPEIPEATAFTLMNALAQDASVRPAQASDFAADALGALGDAEAGKRSLVELMADATDDFQESEWRALDTFATRHPTAFAVCSRLSGVLSATSIVCGICASAAATGVIGLGLACALPLLAAVVALVLPTIANMSALLALSFLSIYLHPGPTSILAGVILATGAIVWAITCGVYRRFSALAALLPAATWLPTVSPGATLLVWQDPACVCLSALLGSGSAWILYALFQPVDVVSAIVTLVGAGLGSFAACFVHSKHPYIAQIIAASALFVALFCIWRRLDIVFAGINCVFLVGSLVLMFVLTKQFEHNTEDMGD